MQANRRARTTLYFPCSNNPTKGYPAVDQGPQGRKALTFQEVYETYVEAVYRFIYSHVGNREDAEDITSQVFLKALKSLDLSRPEPSIARWLYQTASTTIADYWRQFYKLPVTDLADDQADNHSPYDAPHGEDVERARSILARLPENYRKVLELRFLEGLSVKETAQRLGISESNAKVLQHRALRMAAKLDGAG